MKGTVIEQTNHSSIELCRWNGKEAVRKRCRNPSEARTAARWRCEVDALGIVGVHASAVSHAIYWKLEYRLTWFRPSLSQENIAQLLASDADQLIITLRLERGRSLDKYVGFDMKCTASDSDSGIIWEQMASALTHLHALALSHDDVKPENIVWSPEEKRAVLIDFGAALNLATLPEGYFNSSGTPSYAPPEFLQGQKSAKGDVWSLGIVLLFAFRYIALPDGNWLLPAAVGENRGDRAQMVEWLDLMERLRADIERARPVLSEMLNRDPEARIPSSEILLGLRNMDL